MRSSICRSASPIAIGLVVLLFSAGCDHSSLIDDAVEARAPFEPVILDVDPLKFVGKSAKAGEAIPGQYVVVFHDGVRDPKGEAGSLVRSLGGEMLYTYQFAVKGFAARLSDQAAEALTHNPNVASVLSDGLVSKTAAGSQSSPPSWGIDRVDQRNLPLDQVYSYGADGAGVWAYIIDTGINYDHVEFGGPSGAQRAFLGFDGVGDGQNGWDCDGHGTHVAGTVGGATYGVAKQVYLIAVRVLNCNGSGTWSSVLAGVDYVTNQKLNVLPADPAVANMSLGGGYYSVMNSAVQRSVAAGVTYAVSAGNDSGDACTKSPASTPEAITVGSTTSSDQRSSFSNYGTCIDLFAPGSSITSAYYTSSTATATLSGTSMASPHVAGVAAIYLSANPLAPPSTVADVITTDGTSGVVGSAGSGSPNLLLYSLVVGSAPPPPPPADPDPVEIHVEAISSISVAGKSRKKGNVTVGVRDASGAAVPDVTVQGEWTVDGSTEQVSGVTDSAGDAGLSSSNYVGSPLFGFCVTGLTGTDVVDVTDYSTGVCSPYGAGGPEAPSGSPEQLTVQGYSRGVNQRVALDWAGGAAAVVIYRWDSGLNPIDTLGPLNNTGTYTDDLGKTSHGSLWYQVCDDGQPADGGGCTARAEVVFVQ